MKILGIKLILHQLNQQNVTLGGQFFYFFHQLEK